MWSELRSDRSGGYEVVVVLQLLTLLLLLLCLQHC